MPTARITSCEEDLPISYFLIVFYCLVLLPVILAFLLWLPSAFAYTGNYASQSINGTLLLSPLAELAVADALGGGLEMRSAEQLKDEDLTKFHVRPDVGFNEGYQPGMITDDTWMTIGLMRAVVEANTKVDQRLTPDILLQSYRYVYDLESKLMTWSDVKGKWWGGIEPVLRGDVDYAKWISKKKNDTSDPGNGSVMRAHILGYLESEQEVVQFAEQDAMFSHPHPIAIDCSRIIARLVYDIVHKGLTLDRVIRRAIKYAQEDRVKAYLLAVDQLPYEKLPIDATKSVCTENDKALYKLKRGGTGVPCSALPTLAAALYVAKHTENVTFGSPYTAMAYAIRMGGDTDSVAIVATALVTARQRTYGEPSAVFLKEFLSPPSLNLDELRHQLYFKQELYDHVQMYKPLV